MQVGEAAALGPDGMLALGVAGVALVLFLSNRLRADVIGAIIIVMLLLLGLATPREAFAGFSNEATITVALMLVLSAGVLRTGALDTVGRWLSRSAAGNPARLLVLLLAIVIPLSGFINNTAAVALLLPVVLGLAREMRTSPSRLLMPLSFAAQLGGGLTLIGSSANLLVAAIAVDLGLGRLGLFDITPPALAIAAVGSIYLLTLGRRLLPERTAAGDLLHRYELNDYLTALSIQPDSPVAGRSLADLRFGEVFRLLVVRVLRGGLTIFAPGGGTVLQAEDTIIVQGKLADVAAAKDRSGFVIAAVDRPLAEPTTHEASRDARLAELLVPPRSPAIGKSARALRLRARYGVNVLAIRRHAAPLHEQVADTLLEAGDVLLIEGAPANLRDVHADGVLALLGVVELQRKRRDRIVFALPILAGVVLLPALGILPIVVSALLGALLMVLTGCIKPDEAYQDVDWLVIVLLATVLPLGLALQETGAASFLALRMLDFTSPLGLYGNLAAIFLLTTLLTSVITNAAAAAMLAPVAADAGAALGASPMPFVIAVMFAASKCFLTPIGYQTNTFVFGPGGYRFADYLRVGGPLTVLVAVVATLTIPIFFPFHP